MSLNFSSFDKFIIERGGSPFRSVILSTWRSRSTFTGDLLNAHPANFHCVEPLRVFGNRQIRESPLTDKALQVLESIFECNYSHFGMQKCKISILYTSFRCLITLYFHHLGPKENPLTFPVSKYLWSQCQLHKKLCQDDHFVNKMCKLFPYQSMKIVSLRLEVMETFLKQNE